MANRDFPKELSSAIDKLCGEFHDYVVSACETELIELCEELAANLNPLTLAYVFYRAIGRDVKLIDPVLIQAYKYTE